MQALTGLVAGQTLPCGRIQGGTVRSLEGRGIAGSLCRFSPPMWGGSARIAVVLFVFFILLMPPAAAAEAPSSTVLYPARYYPDSPDSSGASSITLRAGETSSPLILAPAPAGGTLTVRILDTEGASVAGILVETLAGRFHAVATTGGDGSATITGIPAGEAILRTRPDDSRSETGAFAVRYAPGVADPALAERFTIPDRQAIDAGEMRIPRAARIKATVLRPNQEPWFDIPVVVRATNGATRYERRTDSSGRVAFGGLEPGSYRLWVDARGSDALTECSDGTRDTLASMPIVLARESLVSGIVIQTDRGGEARGAVRDLSSNAGFPGVEVQFLLVGSSGAGKRFMTDALGFYFAYGLPAGAYRIYVPAIRRWYPSSTTESGARTIDVAEGVQANVADIRGELDDPCRLAPQTAGVIEGGVQADFTRLGSAEIIAWDGPDTFKTTVTETSIYRIGCLPAGSYFVTIVPDGVYRRQYHPLTNSAAGARAVTVTAGDTTRGVNFFPELGVVIEGSVVSDADGMALAQIPVVARNRSLGVVGESLTDKDGLFRIDRLADGTGLPAGDWIVATDSIAVSGIETTALLVVGLEGERTGADVALRLVIPEGMPIRDWSIERCEAGSGPVVPCGVGAHSIGTSVVIDSHMHPDGVFARSWVDAEARGACRYCLTVTTDRYGEAVDLRSDWLEIESYAAGPRSVFPRPWDGRGKLTLPGGTASHEGIDLYGVDGSRLGRLGADRDGAAFEEGRIPASGIYFLRWRGDDGRIHTIAPGAEAMNDRTDLPAILTRALLTAAAPRSQRRAAPPASIDLFPTARDASSNAG